MSNTSNTSGGIGFGGLLTIVFITLKLCGVIDWSWWWVLSPIWISCAIVIFFLGIVGVCALIMAVLESRQTPEQKAARKLREALNQLERRR